MVGFYKPVLVSHINSNSQSSLHKCLTKCQHWQGKICQERHNIKNRKVTARQLDYKLSKQKGKVSKYGVHLTDCGSDVITYYFLSLVSNWANVCTLHFRPIWDAPARMTYTENATRLSHSNLRETCIVPKLDHQSTVGGNLGVSMI